MRRHSLTYRLATTASALALSAGVAAPAALAQSAPPPPPPAAAPAVPAPGPSATASSAPSSTAAAATPPAAPAADPPARVGRLSAINGTVSFHGPGAENWSAATLNYPITNGDALWTEPTAGATLEVSASRIFLSDSTEFDVDMLDAKALTATEPQGESFLQLASLQTGETATVRTPRGTVTLSVAGKYEIAAGDTEHPTVVAVVEGAADVTGDGLSLHVAAGQAATITGVSSFQGSVSALTKDAFLTATLARIGQPAPSAGVAPPPIVASMTGCTDLEQAGTWRTSAQYGTVWYPRVAADWRPYRDGHWSYVGPWGWTWVDDASWGFAPSHYGRWIQVDNAWAWTPGGYATEGVADADIQPVYAPALVTFFGVGAAVGAVAAFGGFGHVGWVPLGPGEPFRPWYRHSDVYVRNINVRNVTNITTITNVNNRTVNINEFRNRGAATVVPASLVSGSQQIGRRGEGFVPGREANVRPIETGLDRPVARGATPALRAPGPAIGGARATAIGLRAPGPAVAGHAAGGVPSIRPGEPVRGPEGGAREAGRGAEPSGVRAAEPGVARGPESGGARAPERGPEVNAARVPERGPEGLRAPEPGGVARPGAPGREAIRAEPRPGEPQRAPEQAARPAAPPRPAAQVARTAPPRVAQVRPQAPRPAPHPIAQRAAPRPVAHAAPRPAPRPAPAQHAGGGGGHRRG